MYAWLRRRWPQFGWSLGLWLLAASFTASVTYLWFPGFHYWIDGGWQGLRMVSLIDLVLGPVLFLIVYRPQKPPHLLRIDFSILLLVQLSAMVYGLWRVHASRPVADVYLLDGFYPTVAADYERHGVDPQRLRAYSSSHPPLIFLHHVEGQALKALIRKVMVQDIPIYAQDVLWQPLRGQADDPLVTDRSALLHRLQQSSHPLHAALMRRFAPLSAHDYALFNGRYGKALLVFDRQERLQGSLLFPADTHPLRL